jgi:hypothetical protein
MLPDYRSGVESNVDATVAVAVYHVNERRQP